jgi:hypothetical protein
MIDPIKNFFLPKKKKYPLFWEGKGKGIRQIAKFLTAENH